MTRRIRVRQRYYIVLSPKTWIKLRTLADMKDVSLGAYITAISRLPLKRRELSSEPLVIGHRLKPLGIALDDRAVQTFEQLARQLQVVSNHGSKEHAGLIVEAYLLGELVSDQEPEAAPAPILPQKDHIRDIYISQEGWAGLKALFGPQPSRTINLLSVHNVPFKKGRQIPPQRRHARHTHVSQPTLEYLATWAQKLDIQPAARMGLISWASNFLEHLGRGGVLLASNKMDLLAPRANSRNDVRKKLRI